MIKIDEYFSFASTIMLAPAPYRDSDPDLLPGPAGHRHAGVSNAEVQVRVVLAFIIAAVVTPTPDMVMQSLYSHHGPLPARVGVAYVFGKKYD
jgi:hypothetical protein